MKIFAVIVTYNRIQFLKRCIASILDQSYKATEIIVVDNDSNDGTSTFLKELAAEMSSVVVLTLPKNVGGAGGFHAGIDLAVSRGADYIWVMDDDAYPEPDCLMQLKSGIIPDTRECICPLIIGSNGEPQHYHHKRIDRWHNEIEVGNVIEPDGIEIHGNAFVGPLFSANLVKDVGLPEKNFFIWYDDVEFINRLSNKTQVWLQPKAKINHQDYFVDQTRYLDWKMLYGIRNKYWTIRKRSGTVLYVYWSYRTVKTLAGFLFRSNDNLLKKISFLKICFALMRDAHRDKLNPELFQGLGRILGQK